MGGNCVSCEYNATIQEDGITTAQATASSADNGSSASARTPNICCGEKQAQRRNETDRQDEAEVRAESSNEPDQVAAEVQTDIDNAKNSPSATKPKVSEPSDKPAKEQASTSQKSQQKIVADANKKTDDPDSNKPLEKPSKSQSPEKVSETPPDCSQKEDVSPSDAVKMKADSIISDGPNAQDKASDKESVSRVDASLMKVAKEDSIDSRKEEIKKETADSSQGGSDISKETSKEDKPSLVPVIDSTGSEQKIEVDSAKKSDSPITAAKKDEFQTPEKVAGEEPKKVAGEEPEKVPGEKPEKVAEEPAEKIDPVFQTEHIHPEVKPKAPEKAKEPDDPFDKVVWSICNLIGADDVLDISKFADEYPDTFYLFELMTGLEDCESPLQRTKVRWALAQKTSVDVSEVQNLFDDFKESYDEENNSR